MSATMDTPMSLMLRHRGDQIKVPLPNGAATLHALDAAVRQAVEDHSMLQPGPHRAYSTSAGGAGARILSDSLCTHLHAQSRCRPVWCS